MPSDAYLHLRCIVALLSLLPFSCHPASAVAPGHAGVGVLRCRPRRSTRCGEAGDDRLGRRRRDPRRIVASDGDTVLFYQVADAKRGPNITNRLSTFVDRFELLYRAEEAPDGE